MRWTMVVAVAVALGSGCMPKQVLVPSTDAGLACYRQCQMVRNTCREPYGSWPSLCASQAHDCLMTCPGAREAN